MYFTLQELFTAANGHLVNHSFKDIFDVTIEFLDPENVDFDVQYAILFDILEQLYCALLCLWRPYWMFGCRKFCQRITGFGKTLKTANQQTTCKKYHILQKSACTHSGFTTLSAD